MVQVEEICDQVTVLNQGQVAFTGSLDAMRADAPDPGWRLSTSDDEALTLARRAQDVKVSMAEDGLMVVAAQAPLDDYVIRLGRVDIAVRRLALDVTPLESVFFALTKDRA
jgi:ABC-2 type transport system ATP-binding protein